MPELFDRPPTQKFNFPGIYDRSCPPQTIAVPDAEDASEPLVKPKRTPRKKAEDIVSTTPKKSLKFGKLKH